MKQPGMFDAQEDGWIVPLGWTKGDRGQCRTCHAEVMWAMTPAGKRAPLNRDGTSHFATCPQANDWRKRA